MNGSHKTDRKRTAVIVLGMHRSGTSALSGVLVSLGIAAPRSLMVPTADNPKGYWESTALMALHDKVLRSAGSSWQDWGKFNPEWLNSPVAARFADELASTIESEFADSPAFLVKDPRMCRLMPLWRSVLDRMKIGARVVLAIRKPIEVSMSLRARNRFGPMQAQAMWLRHVLEAEAGSRGLARSVMTYAELMEDWRGATARLGSELGLAWPRFSAAVEAEVDEFLATDLHRNRREDEDIRISGRPQDGWVQQAYEATLALREDPVDPQKRLDEVMAKFDATCDAYMPVVHEIESRLEDEKKNLQADLASSKKDMEEQVASYERKTLELADRYETVERLLAEKEEGLGQLKESFANLERELKAVVLGRKDLEKLLDVEREKSALATKRHEEELEAADRQNKELERRIEVEQKEALAASQHHREEMEARRSLTVAETSRLQDQISTLKASVDERFEETKKLTEMVFSLEARLETAAEEKKALQGRHRDEMEKASDKIAAARKAAEKAAADVSSLKQILADAQDEAKVEVTALHDAIETQRMVLQHLTKWGDTLLASRLLRTARLMKGAPRTLQVPGLVHDEEASDLEVVRASGYYNPDWYLHKYPDVKRRKMEPAKHYLKYGAREGRNPGPAFDTRGYLQQNPDVVASGTNPLVHYLRYGMQEGRSAGINVTGKAK